MWQRARFHFHFVAYFRDRLSQCLISKTTRKPITNENFLRRSIQTFSVQQFVKQIIMCCCYLFRIAELEMFQWKSFLGQPKCRHCPKKRSDYLYSKWMKIKTGILCTQNLFFYCAMSRGIIILLRVFGVRACNLLICLITGCFLNDWHIGLMIRETASALCACLFSSLALQMMSYAFYSIKFKISNV